MRHSLIGKTPDSDSGITGSNPVAAANFEKGENDEENMSWFTGTSVYAEFRRMWMDVPTRSKYYRVFRALY